MRISTFATPRESRYFDDYVAGAVHEFDPVVVDEEEMLAFARRFDPQVFHVDPEGAKKTHFGGVIASGWFTAGLVMRYLADHIVSTVAALGSPGVNDLKWILPVRPGDLLSIRVRIREARRSRSKPDRGIVGLSIEVRNQHGELAMTMESVGLYLCREKD